MKKNFTFFLNFFGTANWLTKEKMKELTDAKKTKKLCKQILEAKTDEERSKLKKQLYAICWQGRWPEGAKRNNETAESTGCVMLDLDHLDEDVRDYWNSIKVEAKKNHLLAAHITPSGEGLRLVFTTPVGMDIPEAQAYYTRILGLKNVDTCTKDLARLSFIPEHSYWLYCAKDLFEGELPEVEAEKELPEEAVTDTPEEAAPSAAIKDYPTEYQGIQYATIVEQLEDQLGGKPSQGDRNNFIYKMACHLRHICDSDPEWIASFLPDYGEEPKAWTRTIESACQAKKTQQITKTLRTALRLAGLQKEQAEEGSPLPPAMPKRLPDVVWHLTKNTPKQCRPMVAQAIFSPLNAHLKGVKFTMLDGQEREAVLMSIQMAGQSMGKGAVDPVIDCVLEDIERKDAQNRKREEEWKRKNKKKGSNKDKEERPTDLCVQVVNSDMTNAAFTQKLVDADGRFLYTKMSELDLLQKLQGNCGSDVIIRIAFDTEMYGQERVGSESVTARLPLRFLFNASCTPQKSLAWLQKMATDGTVSRLNFSTIIPSNAPFMYGRYDDQYKLKLKPYIDRLNNTEPGVYTCKEALELAGKLQKQYLDLAEQSDSEVLRQYTFRAVVIALWKGYILWLMNDKKWTNDIADFMEWSLDYDLWCKQYFFEGALEAAMGKNQVDGRIKKNLLSLLPDTFVKNDLYELKKAQGDDSEGLRKKVDNCLKQWKKRGFVQHNEETQKWVKTDKFKSRNT